MKARHPVGKTVSYYDQNAGRWAETHGGYEKESYWKAEIDRFKELLPSGKILEIGSGTGKDAEALINLGYEYVGTDASGGMLDIARRRNPGADFWRMSVLDLNFPSNSFDGFWTAATLLHIPKNQINRALQKIRDAVKNTGVGFISMKEGEGEGEDKETGRWFSFYSQAEFSKVLKRNGLEVIESRKRQGEKDVWLLYFVKVKK